jgi:pimeloyl-ACP methyl ester carboxylesterase
MLAVLSHPERFERFVALSIPHPWGRRRFNPMLALSATYQLVLSAPLLGKLSVRRLGAARLALRRARSVGRFSDEEIATYADTLTSPDGAQASMQTYRSFLLHDLPSFVSGAYRDLRLTVPTLWIVGERDQLARHADDGIEDHADDAQLVRIPGAAHFLPEEVPDLVLERSLEFLSAGAARGSASRVRLRSSP